MAFKIIVLTLFTLFIGSACAEKTSLESKSITKVTKVAPLESCSKEGERKCNPCASATNGTPGGSHWVCVGGQWQPGSPDPYNCDIGRLCK